jgi:hypothetical protein
MRKSYCLSYQLSTVNKDLGDQRKSQLHHFSIGFQKPGICAQIPGLLLHNLTIGFQKPGICATRGWAFVTTGYYFLLLVIRINSQVLTVSGGMINQPVDKTNRFINQLLIPESLVDKI